METRKKSLKLNLEEHIPSERCECESVSRSVMSDSLQPHGLWPTRLLQEKILEWVAISFSWGSSRPRDQSWVSCIAGRFFTI